MKIINAAACIALLAGSVSAQEGNWKVRLDGIGPAKIGMSLIQLNAALHEHFTMPANKEDQGCFYVKIKKRSAIALMIEDGHLVRVDVDKAGVSTDKGIQVGDSEKQINEAYGSAVKIEPSKYTGEEGGRYLTIGSSDQKLGVRFETEKGKVSMFYSGTYPAIQYVEGCE